MTRPHSASESVDRKNHDPAGPSSPPPTARAPPPIPIASAPRRGGLYHLKDLSLGTLELAVQQSLETLHPTTQAILILDTPTLPISLQTKPSAHAFWNMLLSLRSQPRLHSAIISIPADDAFVEAAIGADPTNQKHSKTPLEVETAAFVSQCVSQADTIVSCRRLGTGWAKDVSGVLRVTRGGSADVEDGEDARDIEGRHFHHFKRSVEEGEWLYYVAGDGSVKVWARGSATV